MIKRWYFFTFCFLFITLTIGIFPEKVFSQACPAQMSIDRFACNPVANEGSCDPPYFVQNETVSCSWDMGSNSCTNSSAFCSSNDTCVYNAIDKDCYCSGGKVDCNNPPTPGCFLPGTIVNSSGGGKKIEDVKVGDKVDSFRDNVITKSVVSKIYKVTRDYYYSLVAGNYKVKVTAEHPFFVGNDEFKEAKDLISGDDVYVMENESLVKKSVTSNTRINEKTDAYNLSVDNTQTFFANDFAVHNKGGCDGVTVPSGLVIDRDYPGTKINITWTPGSGGSRQALWRQMIRWQFKLIASALSC
jgi:hypothetical protein